MRKDRYRKGLLHATNRVKTCMIFMPTRLCKWGGGGKGWDGKEGHTYGEVGRLGEARLVTQLD